MTNTEILKKLVGNINPIGDSNVDKERYENLKAMLIVIDEILPEIIKIQNDCCNSYQSSVKQAGMLAKNYLDYWKEMLNQ